MYLCLFPLNCSPGALKKSQKGNPHPLCQICPDCSEQHVLCANSRPFSQTLVLRLVLGQGWPIHFSILVTLPGPNTAWCLLEPVRLALHYCMLVPGPISCFYSSHWWLSSASCLCVSHRFLLLEPFVFFRTTSL